MKRVTAAAAAIQVCSPLANMLHVRNTFIKQGIIFTFSLGFLVGHQGGKFLACFSLLFRSFFIL